MGLNGCFVLGNKEDGVYLNIFKASEGGYLPTFEDLMLYCDKKNIEYESVVALKTAYNEALNGKLAKVSSNKVTPFAGWCDYTVEDDGMTVLMKMYPAFAGLENIKLSEVESDLINQKIKFGVDKLAITKAISERAFIAPVVIAKGKKPIDGYDAELIYNFNTTVDVKPKVNDDGTVDFHQLDLINKVKEGDVVATIKPENPGETGMNVYGAVVNPRKVSRKVFKFGRNLKVSEDGYKLVSQVTGHVFLEGDKIFVSNEYQIGTDINTSTGDIDYDGNVRINGNVLSGFKVKATGNIVIGGVVEGAEIVAGGDIILSRGMQGVNKGMLIAGGNIVSNFFENATVKASGNIECDAIMHSKVTAGGEVNVHGKNGYIIGGYVRAANGVTGKMVGSEMGTNTVVGVGVDPEIVMRVEELRKEIMKAAKDKEQLGKLITMLRQKNEIEGKLDAAKTEMLQKSMKNSILLENNIKELRKEFEYKSKLAVPQKDARIKITGTIYPGVKLEIGDLNLFIRDKNNFCQYAVKDGEITRLNL